MSIKIYKDGEWQVFPGVGSPGKSAYQIAVENGYFGTEEEFNEALVDIPDVVDKIKEADNFPIEDSDNLITSGGVYKAIKNTTGSGLDIDLEARFDTVEEDIVNLRERVAVNTDDIEDLTDRWKDFIASGGSGGSGDYSCCDTLRSDLNDLENRVDIIEATGGSGSGVDVEALKDTFDNRYLIKVEDSEQNVNNDVVFHKNVDVKGGLTVDNVKSSNFHSNGFAGSGFGITSDGTDHTLEIDNLVVRKQAQFHELVINQISFTRGATVFSHAGATITAVEIYDDYYRCYYDNSNLKSGFVVGDLGRCQRFDNVVEGFNANAMNHYYWREVVGVGDDYFDLSRTNYDGESIPEEGDDVCQFGNINNSARQSAIVIDPQNGGSIEVYNEIGVANDSGSVFGLTDKNFIGMGTKDSKSYIYGYGDMYFGSRTDGHYIKFDPDTGKLIVNGSITIGDISDAPVGEATLSELLNELGDRIDQIDNKIDYYSGTESVVDGTLSFSNEWITNGEADDHVGDRYTCTADNSIWQFTKDGDNYIWIELDSISQEEVQTMITKALDGHKIIFTDTPETPYDVGDLWVTANYLKYCTKDRSESESFNESDWVLVSDSATNETLKNLESQINEIMNNNNDDDVNFYFDEDSEKELLNSTAENGDIFYAIDTTKAYEWDGTSWNEISEDHSIINVLKALSSTTAALKGKISCYRSDTQPESAEEGDLWFNTETNTLYVYNNGNWEEARDGSLDYLKELFPNYLDAGAVFSKLLAIKNGEAIVAGLYGGEKNDESYTVSELGNGDRYITFFAGAENNESNSWITEDGELKASTKIYSDGHLVTESFALNGGKVTISENDIVLGSDTTDGKITLGFDDDGKPILSYTDSENNNIWNLKEGGLGFTPGGGVEWPESGEFKYDSTNNVWTLGGDLLVTGGVSFYSTLGDYRISTIMDGIEVDGVTIDKNESGQLYVKNAGTSSGIDEDAVNALISNYAYSKSEVYTKDEVIAEIAKVNTGGSVDLSGFVTETKFPELFASNFNDSISGYLKSTDAENTYAKTADLSIDKWNTAYSWGNHLDAGYLTETNAADKYALKTDLSNYLKTDDAKTTYTTISDFEDFKTSISESFTSNNITATSSLVSNNGLTVNGKKLTCTGDVWQLEGDLLVTGGVSFYSALDSTYFDYTDGINVDNTYIVKSNGVISLDYTSLVKDLKEEGLGSGSSSSGSNVSFTQSLTSGTLIGTLTIDGVDTKLYAPSVDDFVTTTTFDSTLNGYVKAVSGMGLSTNDYTDAEKDKLSGLSNYTLPTSSITAIGGIKIYKDNSSYTVTANTSSISSNITSGKYYAVEIDKNDKAFVYVPWTNTTYSVATASSSGLMSNAMYSKLDGIAVGAQVNAVTGVKGSSETSYRTGDIDITKANIGLGNVDNTADSDKEVAYADNAGTATTATKLGSTTVGSATNPIYLKSGTATACTYTLGASVPSGAVFTDTKNTAGTTTSTSTLYLIGATSTGASSSQTYCNSYITVQKADTHASGVINISGTNPILRFNASSTEWLIQSTSSKLYFGLGSSNSVTIDSSMNLTVPGGITFYSQRSLKNIHETDFLSLDQLSNIHAIKYTWKDGRDDRMHVGGIADDIKEIIPEVIYENDGYLTMDYGNAGFVIGTSLIKPVVDHEKRIKDLEAEIERLNNLLNA